MIRRTLLAVCLALAVGGGVSAQTQREELRWNAGLIRDQLSAGFAAEMAGAALSQTVGLLVGGAVYLVFGIPLYLEGVSAEEYFSPFAYYPVVMSTVALNPLLASLGTSAIGESAGLMGT